MTRNGGATRTRLLDAAERLVAAHGVEALSLRAVAAAAGARNTSAAAYHFGTRDQLLDALFETRMGPINARRLTILEEAGGARRASLRALVRALVDPLVASLDLRPGSTHYGRFLAAYLASPGAGERFTALGEPVLEGLQDVTAGLFRHLADVPEPVRNHRVELAGDMVVAAVAGFERDRDRGGAVATPTLLAAMLVDSIVGMLRTPVTAVTTELVRTAHEEQLR
jgi:AcrR family transcriptional regulator